MTTDIRLIVDQFSTEELFSVLLLLVGEDDVASESLSHQEILTKGTRTTSQNFIRVRGNNRTQREDKIMDHLHVEEVGGHGV